MSIGLEAHYDLVTDFIKSYLQFTRKSFYEGLFYVFSKGFLKGLRCINLSHKWYRKHNRLSIKNAPKEYQELLRELLPKRIIENPFYNIWANEWPLEALSEKLREQFPDADFNKLYDIHLLREAQTQSKQPSLRNTLGLVFAACTIVLQITPKELFEKIEFITYGNFKILTFMITLFLAIYILILVLPLWISNRKVIKEFHDIGFILKYTGISLGYEQSET